jgi:hypothetical protein
MIHNYTYFDKLLSSMEIKIRENDSTTVKIPSEEKNTPQLDIKQPKDKSYPEIRIIISILLLGSLIYLVSLFLNRMPKEKKQPPLAIPNHLTPTIFIPQRKTSLIAFIRNGDVWVGSIKGEELKKITSHPKIVYYMQVGGFLWKQDDTDRYAKFPRLSYDGKYLAYVSLTQESIDDVKERELRIATESAEVKKSGTSEIFYYPKREYALHIYNIPEQKEEKIEYQGPEANLKGSPDLLKWASNSNSLFFVKDGDLHIIKERNNRLTYLFYVKNFCGIYCSNLEHIPFYIKPDGSKTVDTNSTGKNCNNRSDAKISIIDIDHKQILEQPPDTIWCVYTVGPWMNDEFIAVEFPDFYKYTSNDWTKKEKLFEDKDYNDGPLALSPNYKYLAYTIGQYRYGSSGMQDIRVRNLQSQEYIDLLSFVGKNKELKGDRILNPKWDSESKYLYFTLNSSENEKTKSLNSSLVRFDINSKEVRMVVENATDSDIN